MDVGRAERLLPVLGAAVPDVSELGGAGGHALAELGGEAVERGPGNPECLEALIRERRGDPRVAGRIGRRSPRVDEAAQPADERAARCRIVLVLKGHRTLTTDGERRAKNTTGNPGMATGGAGDVLTGLIAALVCQGLSPLDAAQLGVYLHGLAGDSAAEQLGQESLTACDLIRYLPAALKAYRRREPT